MFVSADAAGDGTCCPGAGADAVDTQAASAYLQDLRRPLRVGYAVVSASGQVLAQQNGAMEVPGGSITKAMLLVAYLERLGDRPVDPDAGAHLAPMIQESDNADGTWTFEQVGAGAVLRLAAQVGMRGFALSTSDPLYVLGQSRVTALDLARLFARIGQLIPERNRAWAMGLLANLSPSDQWGILSAGIGVTASKAGWYPEPDGWVVNQAGQLETGGQTVGLAILTEDGSSFTAGQQVLQRLAGALFDQNASLANPAAGGCSELVDDVAPVPGRTAVIMPNGLARPPEQAPSDVQAMVAAGDRIHAFDYQYGGGHADPTLSDSQTDPQPQGGLEPGDDGTPGYDCSGATDYVLWGGGFGQSLLGDDLMASGGLESVGDPGPGQWVTIYANVGHAFIEVAGIVLDTVHYAPVEPTDPSTGPRWQPGWIVPLQIAGDSYGGFIERHPPGL